MNAYSAHLLTPQTASSAHYFFTFTRAAAEARAQDNDEEMRALLTGIFVDEDSPMIGAIQQRMGDKELWSLKPASLPGDAGGVRVRRALESLIAAERTDTVQGPRP